MSLTGLSSPFHRINMQIKDFSENFLVARIRLITSGGSYGFETPDLHSSENFPTLLFFFRGKSVNGNF